MQTATLKTFATVSTDVTERTTKKNHPYLAFNAAVQIAPGATQFVKCQVFRKRHFAKQLVKGDRIMLIGTPREVENAEHEIVTLVNVEFVSKVDRKRKEAA